MKRHTFYLFTFYFLLFTSPAWSMTLIRLATIAPEGSTWMETMHAMDEELRERSGGELGFKFYPNMTMGDEKDVIRKIRLGQLKGAGFTGFGLGEILPELRILELPYLFRDDAEIDYITSQLTDYFSRALAERGFVLLGWADVGWIYFLSDKPVAEPTDLKGLKVWMWEGDPLALAFFAELGQSPVPLSINDVHLSLQTGLIDAVYCSPLAALVLQWFIRLKYISDIPFTNSIGAVLVDRKMFDKLSPELQQLLLEISRRHLRALVAQTREDNQEAYWQLIREDLVSVASTESQRLEMQTIGNRVHERLVGELYQRDLLERIRQMLAEYRAGATPGKGE